MVTRVEGTVEVNGTPKSRVVKAFSYDTVSHSIDGESVQISKSLGEAVSSASTGGYTINLLGDYNQYVLVVAMDDYGERFQPSLVVAVGDRVHPTTPDGYVYECDSDGTLPENEPNWVQDTQNSQTYGTASMIAVPFYRPLVHGPIEPIVVSGTFAYEEKVKSLSPLMYYTLAEEDSGGVINDFSGNDYHVSWGLIPTDRAQPPICDTSRGSVKLDGDGWFLPEIVRNPDTDPTTVSFWYKSPSSLPGYNMKFIHQEDGTGTGRNWIHQGGSNDFETVFGGSPANLGPVIVADTLYHIVMTIEPDGRITFWVDGTKQTDFNHSIESATGKMVVGASKGKGNLLVGSLSDFVVWDRILTDTEIVELYNAGTE